MSSFQNDGIFGLYEKETAEGFGKRRGDSIGMLRPSRRVAVPLAMPRHLTGTAHAMQLRGLGDPSFNLPTIPGMPAMPSISLLKVGNLWMVDPAAQPALRGILGMMTFQFNPTPPVQDPTAQNGTLVFVAGQVEGDGAGQIDTYINAGFAALVSTASISTGKLSLLFTQQPSVVATLAGRSSPSFVLLSDQPSAVVTAANKLAGGIAPPPILGGGVTPPAQPVPSPAPAPSTPSWLLPLGVAAVLVGGAAFFYTATR